MTARALGFLLCLIALVPMVVLAQADDRFAVANKHYTDGSFREAGEKYEEMVRDRQWSAPLFYNLGNTYFHLHDFGRAIASYERALVLEPNHPETRTNLSVAREEAHALELPVDWTEHFDRFARPGQYLLAAAIVFWPGLFLFVAGLLPNTRRGSFLLPGFVLLLVAAGLVFVVYSVENGPRGRHLAVVANGETEARLATADTSANVMTLPAGSEVKIEEKRGDWGYALLPNGMHGWVPLRHIEFVRL